MKKFNFIYLLLTFVGVLSMTSCEHKYADYTPGAQDGNMGVYFPSTAKLVVTAASTSVDIAVARLVADEQATVTVRADEVVGADEKPSGLFTFPASVDFNAGESETTYTIAFDGSQLVEGKEYSILVQLQPTEATNYAISEYVFTIIIPEPWEEWGEGLYVDDYYRDLMALAGVNIEPGYVAPVAFEKHGDNPNRIRVKNPASENVFGNLWGSVPGFLNFDGKDHYIEFDITDPNNVVLAENPVMLGFDINFSDGAVPACLYVPENEDGSYRAPITFKDGFITFPQNNVLLGIIDGGSLYMATGALSNTAGLMSFIVPGTVLTDYTISATFDGMYVSADGATAKGVFNFLLGVDVASYKFAFVQGDVTADPSATVTAIVEGAEGVNVYESDIETTKWEVELTKGVYTLVAVPYNAEGEACVEDAYALNFYFNGTGEMPEVEVKVEVGVPSQLVEPERAEEVEANSPACFSIGVKITADASQLKAIKYFVGNGPAVDAAIEAGKVTMDALFDGNDTSEWIATIAEKGSVVGSFSVKPSTAATVFLRFETIYGTNVDVRCEEYTTPEYDGDFPVGSYKVTEGEYESIFTVKPAKSYTTFVFEAEFGVEWYANYDPETSILSMGGMAYGYESWLEKNGLDSLYDIILTIDEAGTVGYAYRNTATADAEEMSALQIEVGENGLEKILTYYSCYNLAYDSTANKWGIASVKFEFTPEATIVPYVEEQPEQPEQPEAQSLSATINAECYAVEAKRAEYVEVVKPYLGELKNGFSKTAIQR